MVLKSHTGPDGELAVTDSAQQWVERCIKDGIDRVDARLALASSGDLQVRYRVEVRVRTTESEGQWAFAAQGPGGALGKEWTQVTTFSGLVLDEKNQQIGLLEARAEGKEAAGIGLFIVIPFPVGWSAATEANACRRFGEELARTLKRTGPAKSG